MRYTMIKYPFLLSLVLISSACVSTRDVSHWLLFEKPLQVSEVGRSQQCGAEDETTRVRYFPDAAALQAWELQRNISLSAGASASPKGAFALVELGRQSTAGYGVVISRLAGRRADVLTLKGTFIAPASGSMQAAVMTSPCVLISLPARYYSAIELVDQNGTLRANSNDSPDVP